MLIVGFRRTFIFFERFQNSIHQGTDAIAVRGGDGNRVSQTQAVEVGIGCRGFETFGLVDRQPGLFRMAACQVGHVLVGCGYAAAPIDHDDRSVRFLQSLDGLINHCLINALLTTGNTAGIDDEIGYGSEFAEAVLAIAGQAGVVGHQRVSRTRETVEQGGLAYVRPTD